MGCPCNCCCIFLTLLFIGGVGVGVLLYEHYTGKEVPILSNIVPDVNMTKYIDGTTGLIKKVGEKWPDFGFDYDNIGNMDDIGGGGYGNQTMIGWKIGKNAGMLSLTVINALTEDWDEYFEVAVNDWNSGNPDVLDLKTTNEEADPQCVPKEGVMKVCNDDYGDTNWKGLNEMLTQEGYIIASVAKMNERYLDETVVTNQDKLFHERKYTMCHEIGHGFGLPHQDEDFNNADLGTCMDYTHRPQNNLNPNQEDFDALNKLYGLNEEARRSLRKRDGGGTGSGGTRNSGTIRVPRGWKEETLNEHVFFNGRWVEKRVWYLPA